MTFSSQAWGVLCLLALAGRGDGDLTPDRFKALHAIVVPKQSEDAWLKVAWLDDLWEARKVAAEKGKPIFIWNANGHPFGGT